MFCGSADAEIIKLAEQRDYPDVYKIHDGLLYHYAGYETMWKILESDSFFARNIRFSNDANEYKTGRETLKNFINSSSDDKEQMEAIYRQIDENPMQYFMVCFCEDGNLLSQWRGYAKNGVSIGLDFSDGILRKEKLNRHVERFCVLNNQKYQQKCRVCPEGKEPQGGGKYYIGETSLCFLQMPYKVNYVDKQQLLDGGSILSNALTAIWVGDADDRVDQLLKYIPFIKDDGFCEERESRLIFDMELIGPSLSESRNIRGKKIEYIEVDGEKKPYINVEFGTPEKKLNLVETVWIGKDCGKIKKELVRALKKAFSGLECVRERSRKGIRVGEGCNQEKIVTEIEKVIETSLGSREQKELKIWCKGHLPIRKIVVGPGERQEEIKESLEYYKNTVYWLRYVDIDTSKIPLRK